MADWENLVAGGFAYMEAPFGVHTKDREKTLLYLQEAMVAGLTWREVEQQLTGYKQTQHMRSEIIGKNLKLAAKLMKEWLE